jgi:cardiolipin synthase C
MSATARDMHSALTPASEGMLAETAARIEGDPGDSAFTLIRRSEEALSWRLALIDMATETLDVQYLTWKGDESGMLLFSRIIEAAQRTVRVRVLVDDLDLDVDDQMLAELDQHTNIAINRWNRATSHLRMQNKMLLADGRFAIVGGRSVGNEHFGLDSRYNFLDVDVLAAGPVVVDLGRAFDVYWTSKPSTSVGHFVRATRLGNLADFIAGERERIERHSELLGRFPPSRSDWSERFEYLPERWHVGRALWLQDEPVAADEEVRLDEVVDLTAAPVENELHVLGAYLIPVGNLLSNLKHLVAEGVRVKVITGTMESVNHTASYAHYRRAVGAILDTGVELYEVDGHPMASVRESAETPPVQGKYVAFHLKGLVGDRDKVFIGSLDLDPTTLVISAEAGLYIESAGLGGELADWYDEVTGPGNAWRVTKDPIKGELTWTSGDRVRNSSPDRGPLQRFAADVLEGLPLHTNL